MPFYWEFWFIYFRFCLKLFENWNIGLQRTTPSDETLSKLVILNLEPINLFETGIPMMSTSLNPLHQLYQKIEWKRPDQKDARPHYKFDRGPGGSKCHCCKITQCLQCSVFNPDWQHSTKCGGWFDHCPSATLCSSDYIEQWWGKWHWGKWWRSQRLWPR